MNTRYTRLRRRLLTVATGTLFFLGGCGLSDYQLATVWQSVLTTGINTAVTGALANAFGLNTDTGTTTGG
ncbi:MAG: hypothetical protein AB1716_08505 [Planctomycetota bacterium]